MDPDPGSAAIQPRDRYLLVGNGKSAASPAAMLQQNPVITQVFQQRIQPGAPSR